MRDISNIRTLIPLQMDWMGLIFYPKSKRHVGAEDPLVYQSLNVTKVGVFVNSPKEEVLEKVKSFGLEYVQLHGDESFFYCQEIQDAGVKVIKAFSVDNNFNFKNLISYSFSCDYFLFDTKGKERGGNGEKFDWNILSRYEGDTPFILSGGIGPDAIEDLKKFKHPKWAGVDLNSKFEIEPALKDIDSIGKFIKEFDPIDDSRINNWKNF